MYAHGFYAAQSTSDLHPAAAASLAVWHDDDKRERRTRAVRHVTSSDFSSDSEEEDSGSDSDSDDEGHPSQTASIRNTSDLARSAADDELDDLLDAFDDLDVELCGERETLSAVQPTPEHVDDETGEENDVDLDAITARTGLAPPVPPFRAFNRMRSESDLTRPSRSVRWLKPSKSSSPLSSSASAPPSSPTLHKEQLLNVAYAAGPDHLCSSDLLLAAAAASSLTFTLSGTWGPQIDPASFCAASSSDSSDGGASSSAASSPTMSHSSFHSHCSWSSADMESDFEAYRRFARADDAWSSRSSLDDECASEADEWHDDDHQHPRPLTSDAEADAEAHVDPPAPRSKSNTSLHRSFLHLGRRKKPCGDPREDAAREDATSPPPSPSLPRKTPSVLQLRFVGKLAERRRKSKGCASSPHLELVPA